MTQSAPVVSIQAPKDVSLNEVEVELSKIWQGYNAVGNHEAFPAATRAATFSLVVYEPEETQQLLGALGFYSGPVDGIDGPRTDAAIRTAQSVYGLPITGKSSSELITKLREEYSTKKGQDKPDGQKSGTYYAVDSGASIADAIASQNPCRIIALCPMPGEDEGVTAQVSAYCPIQKHSRSTLICCEYITLRGTETALERVGDLVSSLFIVNLPKFLWWKTIPDVNQELFKQLAKASDSVIIDSSYFHDAETELLHVQSLIADGNNVADLNWRRLAPWQELAAEAFDPPERRSALGEVDRITIDYEKGNSAQALMFLGWFASRLQWYPISYHEEGGDYDLKQIEFSSPQEHIIRAELAAIPTADTGEISGDLIGLRLTSTNLNADCCTILCSETTGCMRMEAGGSAQSCSIQQVTPLFDQKAEFLLGQQLQRWGRELLYEESLAVTAQILKLRNQQG